MRLAFAVAAGVLFLFAGAIAYARWQAFDARGLVGIDHATFVAFGQRWVATGSMYLPYQLAGPYEAQPLPHVPAAMPSMYPPTAAYLFAAASVLPAVLWWLVPLAVVGHAVASWRPSSVGWVAIAALLCHPASSSAVIAGNSTMWVAAGVAAGLRWGWPAALILLKPNLAVLAAVGLIRWRAFALGLAALAVLSLPLAGEWLRYPAVVLNSDATGGYLPFDPLALVPLVAWASAGRRVRTPARGALPSPSPRWSPTSPLRSR